MIKYDLKLIYDYIAGNDIEEDIEQLENNGSFMKLVLKVSKDKNMFKLCSDNLRNDLSFIKDVVDIFFYDEDFISEIIDDFIDKNNDNPFEKIEASLLACKYIKDSDLLFKYYAKANVLYLVTHCELASILEEERDEYFFNELGKGFGILKDSYTGYPLATEFCAKKVLEEIFDEIPNLETYLHNSFKNAKILKEYGLRNFIIGQVSLKDIELANYLKINPGVTIDVKTRLERYIKNWDTYEKYDRLNRIEIIYGKILEYFIDNSVIPSMDLDLFIYYILSKYGIEKEVYSLDPIVSEEKFMGMLNDIKNGIIDERLFTKEELKVKDDIERIINVTFNQKIYKEDYIEDEKIIFLTPKRKC